MPMPRRSLERELDSFFFLARDQIVSRNDPGADRGKWGLIFTLHRRG